MKQGQKFLSGFVKGQMPRGIALFFAAFALLNLIGDLRAPGFDANSWWIDLSFLPPFLEMPLILVVALALGLFAVRPPDAKALQNIITIVVGAVAVLAMINAGQFYRELFMGNIRSGFPVPLSLFVGGALLLVAKAAFRDHASEGSRLGSVVGVLFSFGLCLFLFPILQVFCFGKTDYRRKADAIVVLGARAYADGRPSDALADRVRTAVELYKQDHADTLIMSGGPGDGDIHETEAMKRFAIKLGVPAGAILKDERGLNTQATVQHTQPIFRELGASRILVVSHFYHLPRIKMTYAREGWNVFTVPAREEYFLRETPYMIVREVAGLWVYYLRPLR